MLLIEPLRKTNLADMLMAAVPIWLLMYSELWEWREARQRLAKAILHRRGA